MNNIIDISHSFRARDQFYELLTVRFAFQILNAKDQSNQVETSLQSPKIWLPETHVTAVCSLAANLSHPCYPCFGSPHREVMEVLD